MQQPQLSTVSADNWADWSVAPLTGGTGTGTGTSPATSGSGSECPWTTLLVEKSGDEHGKSLWVYRLVVDEETGQEKERVALREICWVYGLEDQEEWEVEVVAMAARPEKNPQEGEERDLVVKVRGWDVKWEE